jgi:RNA polymerase sigma-70 factor (ECF subfamily)
MPPVATTRARSVADAVGGAARRTGDGAAAEAARRIAEEAAIVQSVLDGQTDVFRHLVARYQAPLVATLYRLVGRRHDAEDLAQQSFVDAFDALARFDQSRRFSTWLFRIGINNAKDWLKSHKRGERSLDTAIDDAGAVFAGAVPGPDRAVAARQELARVVAALDLLPIQFREVIVLKDVQELSYEEIQDILGHSIATLKIRAVRGRAALRKLLDADARAADVADDRAE